MSLDGIKQCEICRKLFQSYSGKICPGCLFQIEEDFVTVKEYLYIHPEKIDAKGLSEATGVNMRIIVQLMRDGRILEVSDTTGALRCQVCGKAISSGTICPGCAQGLAKSLGDAAASVAAEKAKKDSHDKMQGRTNFDNKRWD